MSASYMRNRLNEIYQGKIALGGGVYGSMGGTLVGGVRRKKRTTSRGYGYHKALSGMGSMRYASKSARRRTTIRRKPMMAAGVSAAGVSAAGVSAAGRRRRTVRG